MVSSGTPSVFPDGELEVGGATERIYSVTLHL